MTEQTRQKERRRMEQEFKIALEIVNESYGRAETTARSLYERNLKNLMKEDPSEEGHRLLRRICSYRAAYEHDARKLFLSFNGKSVLNEKGLGELLTSRPYLVEIVNKLKHEELVRKNQSLGFDLLAKGIDFRERSSYRAGIRDPYWEVVHATALQESGGLNPETTLRLKALWNRQEDKKTEEEKRKDILRVTSTFNKEQGRTAFAEGKRKNIGPYISSAGEIREWFPELIKNIPVEHQYKLFAIAEQLELTSVRGLVKKYFGHLEMSPKTPRSDYLESYPRFQLRDYIDNGSRPSDVLFDRLGRACQDRSLTEKIYKDLRALTTECARIYRSHRRKCDFEFDDFGKITKTPKSQKPLVSRGVEYLESQKDAKRLARRTSLDNSEYLKEIQAYATLRNKSIRELVPYFMNPSLCIKNRGKRLKLLVRGLRQRMRGGYSFRSRISFLNGKNDYYKTLDYKVPNDNKLNPSPSPRK